MKKNNNVSQTCTTCSGSGEGSHDGSRCLCCDGSGVEKNETLFECPECGNETENETGNCDDCENENMLKFGI